MFEIIGCVKNFKSSPTRLETHQTNYFITKPHLSIAHACTAKPNKPHAFHKVERNVDNKTYNNEPRGSTIFSRAPCLYMQRHTLVCTVIYAHCNLPYVFHISAPQQNLKNVTYDKFSVLLLHITIYCKQYNTDKMSQRATAREEKKEKQRRIMKNTIEMCSRRIPAMMLMQICLPEYFRLPGSPKKLGVCFLTEKSSSDANKGAHLVSI